MKPSSLTAHFAAFPTGNTRIPVAFLQLCISVAESNIPPRRDGTKNVLASYKRNPINIIEVHTCRDDGIRSNVRHGKRRFPALV